MACKFHQEKADNALDNLSEMFKVEGKRTLNDFLKEADQYLDSMNNQQLNELKTKLSRFNQWFVNRSKNARSSVKRKRSLGGTKNAWKGSVLGGAWQPPGPPGSYGGPPGPPGSYGGPPPETQPPGSYGGPPVPPVSFVSPLRLVQPVLQTMGSPMGSPVGQSMGQPMGQPVQMPRGPQGPGVVRGLLRVGVTFFSPRTNTGVIYAGIWLAIALLAGFSSNQHQDFLLQGINQIRDGSCLGATGFFDAARHPLCTKWRELMIPMLTALNEVMRLNMRGLAVLSAGVGVMVTVPLMIDSVIYELAYNVDYVLTTALQSFSGRPLIPPARDPRRPSLPLLAGRMLSLVNPLQMASLTQGQHPDMTQQLSSQYFTPQQGQPFFGQAYGPGYNQGYGQQGQVPQGYGHAQQMYAQQVFGTPMPYAWDPRMAQQMPPRMAQWDPRMAQERPGSTNINDNRNDNRNYSRSRRRRNRSRSRSKSRRSRSRHRNNANN